MPESLGDAAQTRKVAEQVGEAAATIAVHKLIAEHPDVFRSKPEIPAPLKWAGGITAALLATGVGGTAVWLMTTVNEMQVTLARMDERMSGSGAAQGDRDDDQDRRITRLEQFHERGGR
jgi:hypothetical protein